MKDTSPEMAVEFQRMFLALSPARRLAMACGMFQTAKALARAGILQNGPLPEREVRRRLFLRFYGNEFSELERARILTMM